MDEDAEARVHAMIAEACLGVDEAPSAGDLRAWLEARGITGADADAILAAPARLSLYRRLVRNNLEGVTHKMLARTKARLDARGGLFTASFAEFVASRGPRTHYLRDVPHEFLAWAEATWPARGELPRWALDLARHELAQFMVSAAPDPPPPPAASEIALDRALLFAEPLRLLRYAFAVHDLPEAEDDLAEPAERASAILVYRAADHDVQHVELSPLGAALVERLLQGSPLGAAVAGACEAIGAPRTESVMAEVSRLLADLAERGALLGARAPGQ